MSEQNKNTTSFLTLRSCLKLLALFLLVFAFCPSFLVSCSGQTTEIGLLDVIPGMESYGERIIEPQPLYVLCFILPLVMLVILFFKKMNKKTVSAVLALASAADLAVWFGFRSQVRNFCSGNTGTYYYLEYESTIYFKLTIFLLILFLFAGLFSFFRILDLDDKNERPMRALEASEAVTAVSAAADRIGDQISEFAEDIGDKIKGNENVICYCHKCGKPVEHGETSCKACGTAVPEAVLEAAEAEYQAKIEAKEREAAEAEAKRQAELKEAEERRAALAEQQEKAKAAAAAAADPVPDAEEPAAEEITAEEPAEEAAAPKAPAFCENCGAPIPEGAKFCENCGKRVIPLE